MKTAAFLFTFLIFLFSASIASATTNTQAEPKKLFIRASTGSTTRETILLKNLTSSVLNLKLGWKGYEPTKKHSINFASLSTETLTLQPYGVDTIEIEFDVPKNAAAADYYGALFANGEEQTEFTVSVSGKLIEDIRVENFSDEGRRLNLTLLNNGNRTTKIIEQVEIRDLFGNTTNLNLEDLELKAGDRKTFELNHGSLFPGLYQAKISLNYGSKENQLSVHSFWISGKLLLIAGSIIIAIFFILWAKRKIWK